jgi:cell division protein FtsN
MTTYPDKNKQRPYVKPQVKQRRQALKRFWLGVFVAFVGGYSLACVYQPALLTTWVQAYLGGHEASSPSQHSLKASQRLKPKLEFYTLLTQEKTTPNKSKPLKVVPPRAPVQAVAAEPVQVSESTRVYVLQLASFQRREDAEHMQASLIMRGLDATIKTVTQQGAAWHRVMMGPFASHAEAEKVQGSIARSERISGMIRRMDV